MQFSDVKYQAAAQARLQRALGGGRLPHAYLFAGPSGIGKELLAQRLAARLLCASPRRIEGPSDAGGAVWTDSCGTCDDCVMMAAGTHPDYHRVHRMLSKVHPDQDVRKRKALDLGIDVIREFAIKPMGLRAAQGRAKVFVIVEAERLNAQAQNAMLKTLEEPPAHAYVILLAAGADALFQTIRSRCQAVSFRTLPEEFVADRVVEAAGVDANAARYLSALSEGRLGAALRYAKLGVQERIGTIDEAVGAARVDALEASKRLQALAKELAGRMDEAVDEVEDEIDTNAAREAYGIVFAMIAGSLRGALRAALGLGGRPLGGVGPREIGAAIRAVVEAEKNVARNAHVGLTFDVLAIELGRHLGAKRVSGAAR